MNVPDDLLYTDQHEWIRRDDGAVGITDYAQDRLSDVTYVELPEVGKDLQKGEELAAIESCKAAASLYAPASGKVAEVNSALEDDPALLNSDPYAGGWVAKIELSDPSQLDALMTPDKYRQFLADES